MLRFLASLLSDKPAAIPARRIRAVLTSHDDRVTAREWGGRNYWHG